MVSSQQSWSVTELDSTITYQSIVQFYLDFRNKSCLLLLVFYFLVLFYEAHMCKREKCIS